jgi:hypothetical protein
MNVETIKQAVEYKQGHFNMVQYILKEKPEWTISVYDKDEARLEEQSKIIKLKLFAMIIGIKELVGHGLFLTMKVMKIL